MDGRLITARVKLLIKHTEMTEKWRKFNNSIKRINNSAVNLVKDLSYIDGTQDENTEEGQFYAGICEEAERIEALARYFAECEQGRP